MHSIPETSILLVMGQPFHVQGFFAFTAALPFKNCCFSWSLMLQKQRGDWSHMSITLPKKSTLFFIGFDVAQTKTGRCMFWVACFASLHTSILTSLVIVNHTWYSKCIPSQQIQWFAAFFMTNLLFPLRCWFDDFPIQFNIDASQRVSSWNQRGWLVYVMSYLFG